MFTITFAYNLLKLSATTQTKTPDNTEQIKELILNNNNDENLNNLMDDNYTENEIKWMKENNLGFLLSMPKHKIKDVKKLVQQYMIEDSLFNALNDSIQKYIQSKNIQNPTK